MENEIIKKAKELISNIDIHNINENLKKRGVDNYHNDELNIIRQSILNVLNDNLKSRNSQNNKKIDKELIHKIINNFKNKNGDKLNSKSYDIYIKKADRMKIWNNINELIDNQDNKQQINIILDDMKKRNYMTKRKDENKSSFNADFVFYNQIITKDPIKNQLNEYVLNRIVKIIQESKKIKEEMQLDKTLYDKLNITYTEFIKFVDEITNKDKIESLDTYGNNTIYKPTIDERILLNLYKYIPVRDNFSKVYLTDKNLNNDVNYINITNKTFHLNNYKKSAMETYGVKVYKIPDYINDMILKKYNDGWRVLMGKNKHTFYNENLSKKISNIFMKYLNKNVSINDIRRAYTTYWAENKSVKQQKELAGRMLHSYKTGRDIYKREQNKE